MPLNDQKTRNTNATEFAAQPFVGEQMRNTSVPARTVIDAAGRPRRLVLRQPPHYRTGVDAPRVQAAAEREAARALRQSDAERNAHYRSNGTRPREC